MKTSQIEGRVVFLNGILACGKTTANGDKYGYATHNTEGKVVLTFNWQLCPGDVVTVVDGGQWGLRSTQYTIEDGDDVEYALEL